MYFAHDHGLIQIPARGRYHYGIARHEMGFVEPVPEPTRGGRADRPLMKSAGRERFEPSRSTLLISDDVMLGEKYKSFQ